MVEQFCDQDTTVGKIVNKLDGMERKIIVVSAYFPYDPLLIPPPRNIEVIVNYAESNHLGLIIGCDANSQHTIWGSTKCNKRGEKLLDFILSFNLVIHNKGSTPTFVNKIRQQVIDMTLTNQKASSLVQNWSVLDEDSLSDHRYIGFNIGADKTITPTGQNPRKANWTVYTRLVDERMGNQKNQRKLSSVAELNNFTNTFCNN